MNHRFVSASLALACLIVIGASVPAQAGDWGRPGYGHHHNVPTPSYWGWKRGHFNHHHGHWGRPAPRPIRCGSTGIRTSKLFHERRLRPALNDGSSGGGIIRLRLVSPRSASPNHDGVSELKGRRDVPQRLYCFPRPPNGERAKSKTRPKIDWLTSTLSIFAMLIFVVSRCTSPVL